MSGRRRSTHSLLVCALAAWFGAIPALALIHLRTSPHWFCPEHLRYEDMRRAADGGRAPSAQAPNGLGRDGSTNVRTHVRCDVANDFIGGSALAPSFQPVVLSQPDAALACLKARPGFAPILVLGFAPKHSPPAPLS